VRWAEKYVGIALRLRMQNDEIVTATTTTAANELYFDFLSASKPVEVRCWLSGTATVASVVEKLVISYETVQPRPDKGVGATETVFEVYEKLTVDILEASTDYIVSGSAMRAPTQRRDNYMLQVELGQSLTAEGLVYTICSDDLEAAAAYDLLRGGATVADLKARGFSSAKAAQLIGAWYMLDNAERAASIAEKAAFDALKTKTYAELISILSGAEASGIQLPALEEFLAASRSGMDANTRAAFINYLNGL
jgi:hypothetical protein